MPQTRRQFIEKIVSLGVYGLATGYGILHASILQAFELPARQQNSFKQAEYPEILEQLFADTELIESSKISFSRLPTVAENGAAVPITVSSKIKNINKISILVEHNPHPLIAEFHLSPVMVAKVSARMKMAKTSRVIAIVEAEGKYYHKSQKVKVTVGGCG